jgi:thiol-disulfide isomerase/thioredoxin
VPESPRFGWRPLLASTALAAIAAAGTYVLLDGGDDGGGAAGTTVPTIALDPEVEVDPESATFLDFDGQEVPLTALRGRPVVVNFFASTCVPCVTEMPAFEEVHQDVGDRVTFLGLALQDRREAALELVERTGVTYRTAQDREGAVFTALEGIVLPTTVLLDADGEVVDRHAGALTADELREWLADRLGIET